MQNKDTNWYIYLLTCNDGTIYTGISNDVSKRIEKHNSGKGAKYTKTRLPVSLLKFFTVASKSEALKIEYKIKKLSRQDKIALSDIETLKGERNEGSLS